MTAREQIKNYEQKVREYTNFAVRGIKKVCKECGPRPGASEAERKAQEMMRRDLEPCCDEVRMEPFQTAPKAFLAWVRLSVVLGLLAAAAYNLGYAAASLALLLVALLSMVLEFLLYKQALDVFFKKHPSQNLVAVQKPTGEVKRRLILCGHADSSNEWSYTYLGYKLFKNTMLTAVCVFAALSAVLFGAAISVLAVARGQAFGGPLRLDARGSVLNILGYVFGGLCLPLIAGWFFENQKLTVVGANDNLTGCFTGMAVAKLLGETDNRLKNTELVILCTGCEEPGLRGAKAFMKAHADEYKDVETAFIALDTITDYEYMGIYIKDMTNTVQHDPAVSTMIRKAGNTAGFDLPYSALFFGASDAAAASQGGMRAAAFAAMDPAPAAFYHTRLDTCDVLQPKTVEACVNIMLETAFQFDETGLAPFEGSKVKIIKH